jgi:hypothetical protein
MSDSSNSPSDCLVFKITEICTQPTQIDNSLFIIYDTLKKQYIIRGKRTNGKSFTSEPYSFIYEETDIKNLINFIKFVTCYSSLLNYELYNYDNLPIDSNDITFEFLNRFENPSYEIVAYDNIKFNAKELKNIINMLRTLYNHF